MAPEGHPRGAHAATRTPGRRPARGPVLAGLTVTALAAASVLAPFGLAQASPQRVLQAVEISIGTDGAIRALSSTDVRRSADDVQETTTRRLDPSAFAADLPVRVTTSYVHDGRVGTDLADLRGATGLVELNVTVQNTTVRPERFQYDAAGVPRDSYELVATPLTVVASASLPEGSFGDIRQPQPGTTEDGTTNGVVSTDDSGDTTVQWASLLAPPRLAGSTTFTLVQDAEDFQLPDLTVTVQPGLATDTSVTRLLGDAFGGSAALVGGENNTIGLIANINATLAQATDSLESVQQTLTVSAGEVGSAATSSLTATAGSLEASTAAVLADLQALNGSVAGTVDTTNSQALGSLQTSVRGVLDYFGTPTTAQTPATADGSCGLTPTAAAPAQTLLGQLSQVSAQLRQLSTASDQCVQRIETTIDNTIGDPATCPAPGENRGRRGGQPLVCQLQGSGSDLVELAGKLMDASAVIVAGVNTEGFTEVAGDINALVETVQEVQTAGRALDPNKEGSTIPVLIQTLDTLAGDLEAAVTATDSASTTKTREQLAELARLATARLADLQAQDTGVQAQLAALAASICASATDVVAPPEEPEPVEEPEEPAEEPTDGEPTDGEPTETAPLPSVEEPAPVVIGTSLDDASRLVNGKPCKGNRPAPSDFPFPTPLTERLATDVAGWLAVLAATDVTAEKPTGAAAELLALEEQLRAAAAAVQALQAQVTDAENLVEDDGEEAGEDDGAGPPRGRPLRVAIRELVTQLEGLHEKQPGAATCDLETSESTAPLNRLAASFSVICQEQQGLAATLTANLDELVTDVRSTGTDDLQGVAVADALRSQQELRTDLDQLFDSLTGQLDVAAVAQEAQGSAVVAQQQARLAAVQAAAEQELDEAAQAAIGRLGEQVAQANTSQAAASAALQAQLQKVLLDLGSASQGRGLLGVIQNSAGQTGVRTAQVEGVSTAAASFRGVRLAELADAQLEQQQLARSLQSAQLFPAFAAPDLPAGSTHTTVFVLRIGSEA